MNPTTWLRLRGATHRSGQLRAGHEQMRGLRALLFAALAGSGASGVALGGEYGQLPDPETQTPEGWLQNCLIYATESVNAIGTFRVFPGLDDPATFRSDICSAEMVSIGGLSGALVPQGAPTLYDVALAAPTINLERLSRSSDCVFDEAIGSGLTIGDSPSIVPCEPVNRRNLDLSGMPADPAGLNAAIPFPTINPGAVDVVVLAGTTRELDPGAYGRITLEFNSTLVLKGPGNYEVRSIATIASSGGTRGEETRAYIEVESEGVSLMVKEYMALGHRSRVNVAGTRLFKIYVEGGDANAVDTWYSGNPSVTGFAFRGDGALKACWVYSPNATQMWRGQPNPQQTDYQTQSFARAFEQQDGLAVIMTHPQDPGCYGEPVPDVVCDSMRLDPSIIDADNATVRATVTLRNLSQPASAECHCRGLNGHATVLRRRLSRLRRDDAERCGGAARHLELRSAERSQWTVRIELRHQRAGASR